MKAKQTAKNVAKALVKKIAKKVAKAVVKFIFKMVKAFLTKLIAFLVSFLGVPGLVIGVCLFIVGGAVIVVISTFDFGWIGSDSPKTQAEIKEEYNILIEDSSELEQYKVPKELVTAIDGVRIIKEDLKPWEIKPEPIVDGLSPDITYKTYENTYKVKKVKEKECSVENSNSRTTSGCDGDTTTSYSETTKQVEKTKEVHTWNKDISYSYKESDVNDDYELVDTYRRNGEKVEVYEKQLTKWVSKGKDSTPNYSKFDTVLADLDFKDDDVSMLIAGLQQNSISFNGYTGEFSDAVSNAGGPSNVNLDDVEIPEISKGSFTRPAAGPITSHYGQRWGTTHHGIDIGKSGGATPIVAAADGNVYRSYFSSSYGESIYIRHHVNGQLYDTIYAHMVKGSRTVRAGENVKKGEVIGFMGSTGQSTGPHLHFEIHKGKWNYPHKTNSINPYTSGLIKW
ncbi:peptidoglycan DD-metalloendopeptidase family protein [Pontibacillus yanchengensis]|uniref:Peptidoglycan DD-metalloendopeptidase family protein n=3 Tax=Pontibacillus yanchengensis TaxID=462910 RepID=A0A6I5A588_9BACI|nr:peptidoglycan DD-metalloendopeptidase family protein [Pontibacillus yanchengensis]MYL55693.1 peptidoglycan DD-metalloendopeptidase family protein [Pontibacillus yanchengensis]